MAGGMPGALGRHQLIRADGKIEELPGITQLSLNTGDVLVIETPGGGGFGEITATTRDEPSTADV